MKPQAKFDSASIVLRGHFSPSILQPAWLAARGLVREEESEAAEIELIHPSAAVYSMAWLQISVRQDKFVARTSQQAYHEPLRDLVAGVFDILGHTPLQAMGLNRDFHFELSSENEWHRIGHRLVPKSDWEQVLDEPGTQSLTVQGLRSDDLDGYVRITIEPSVRVRHGLYVLVNDHYQLATSKDLTEDTSQVLSVLSENWKHSMDQSLRLAERLSSLGSE